MKIELDLDQLRQNMDLRKKMIEDSNSITLAVRKWGETCYAPFELSDEILIDQMKQQISARIQEFMQYAPDISDIKPNDIEIHKDYLGRKAVIGSFYYCSQIVDYWKKQEGNAVRNAQHSARCDAFYELRGIFAEISESGEKECWQKEAMKYIDENFIEDYEGEL